MTPLLVVLVAAVMLVAGSHPLVVQSGDASLRGVLDLPDGAGPFPLLLIIPGSGPTNADGNSINLPNGAGYHHSPYTQIARGLTAAGIAVAHMNKRGLPPSTGMLTSIDDYVTDALSVVRELKTKPSIDSRRVFLFGHSEGGLIALLAAARGDVSGIVLAAAPGRPLHDIITDQAITAARQRCATDADLDRLRREQEAFYAGLRQYGGNGPLTFGGTTFPEDAARLLKSEIDLDPVAIARRVRVPVLVLQGDQDFVVAPDNARALASALPNATLAFIPNMSHAFTVALARMSEVSTNAGTPLHPDVIPTLVTWLQKFM